MAIEDERGRDAGQVVQVVEKSAFDAAVERAEVIRQLHQEQYARAEKAEAALDKAVGLLRVAEAWKYTSLDLRQMIRAFLATQEKP